MKITENCPLKGRNTFGMDVTARCLIDYSCPEDLQALAGELQQPVLVMGGGSNLLFMDDFKGTILHSTIEGIEIAGESDDSVYVRVGSGVAWDDFVAYSVLKGWWGIENLSAIPGDVGAGAVQNIGAYGVEIKDVIETVQTVSLEDGTCRDFSSEECEYAYRQSIFKNSLKGRYAVTYVIFRLGLKPCPRLGYGALRQAVEDPTLKNIRSAVIAIRNSKLPDPQVLGNAGSFFMNPVVPESDFERIREMYPDVPSYPAMNGMVKVPAGWMIEKAGWKGRSLGPARCYEKQALVLVNAGGATGADIRRLADTITADVRNLFGITLSTEVNYI